MARLEITVHGQLSEIAADHFVMIVHESLQILESLDRVVSERRGGAMKWLLSGLRESSAGVLLQSRVVRGQRDYGEEIANRFTGGIEIATKEGTTPPLYSEGNMHSILKIVKAVGRNGVRGVRVRREETPQTVELTSTDQSAIEQLVGVHHVSIGSIEGHIELVSIRRGRRRFNIYQERTQKAVRCTLPDQLENNVIDAMRGHRRVIVHGLISYNAKGEPQSIQVQRALRILGREDELPTPDDLLGSIPDITNGVTTAEHFQRLHNG